MMSWLLGGMAVFSVIAAAFGGRMPELSAGALGGCRQALELGLTIAATMALWNGVMRIAEKSGLTAALGRLMLPLTKGLLFPTLRANSPAMEAISMNLVANLLGLGNAATPLGIAAMRELEKEAGYPTRATCAMMTFVALNTASLQLVPTTTAFLRLQAGALRPMDIVVPVWISSLVAVTVAVLLARGLCTRRERRS